MPKKIQFVLAFLLLGFGFPGSLRAAERTALRESVVTHGDSVYLSDLLPSSAAEEIRARTSRFALGNSPLPGTHRRFEKYEIERALRGSPELLAQLIVPETVDVTRWSQPLGREQIRAALLGRGTAGIEAFPRQISIDQIEAPGEVLVTDPAARLEILRVEDSGGPNVQVRMWIPSEPKAPAFWITVRRKGESFAPLKASGPTVEDRDAAEPIVRSDSGGSREDAVKKGARLELVFLATGMRITTPAQALDAGKVGQKIRVRSLATGKVLRAMLTGPAVAEVHE